MGPVLTTCSLRKVVYLRHVKLTLSTSLHQKLYPQMSNLFPTQLGIPSSHLDDWDSNNLLIQVGKGAEDEFLPLLILPGSLTRLDVG